MNQIEGLKVDDKLICTRIPHSGHWKNRFKYSIGEEVIITEVLQVGNTEKIRISNICSDQTSILSNTEMGWIMYFKKKEEDNMKRTITVMYLKIELEVPANTVVIAMDISGIIYAYSTDELRFITVGYWVANSGKFVQVGKVVTPVDGNRAKNSLRRISDDQIINKKDETMNEEDQFTFTTSQKVSVNEVFAGICRDKPIGICRNVDTGECIVAVDNSYIGADENMLSEYPHNLQPNFTVFPIECLADLNPFLERVRSINRSTGVEREFEVTITA